MDVTYFKILSHACLLVKRGKTSLIVDPWISGSCYWRSWWNYPEPQ
jgi:UDP-MurNAc hydroxylase